MLNCPNKQFDSDPIPTRLLKECASVLTPTITNIVNLSLAAGQFHPILKEDQQLSNYRPISKLSPLSNIIERVIKARLTDHLASNDLLNSH